MTQLEKDFDNVFPDDRGVFGIDPYGSRKRAILNYMQSVLTRAIKKERQAWLNHERCYSCGKPVEPSPTSDTCGECLENN